MDFDKVNLKNGDKIRIKDDVYEVLYVQEEADSVPHKNPPFRSYLGIYLHDSKTKSLYPTHYIKYYYDTKEIFLMELQGRKIKQEDISLETVKD